MIEIAECNFHGTNVVTYVPLTIRRGYLALLDCLQIELKHDVLRETQMHRSSIDQRHGRQRCKPGIEGIA